MRSQLAQWFRKFIGRFSSHSRVNVSEHGLEPSLSAEFVRPQAQRAAVDRFEIRSGSLAISAPTDGDSRSTRMRGTRRRRFAAKSALQPRFIQPRMQPLESRVMLTVRVWDGLGGAANSN